MIYEDGYLVLGPNQLRYMLSQLYIISADEIVFLVLLVLDSGSLVHDGEEKAIMSLLIEP